MNFDGFPRSYSSVHVASGAAIFTLILRRRVAFLHRSATCRPLFKPPVSLLSHLKDNEVVFQTFIGLLRFSFDSPSYIHTHTHTHNARTHARAHAHTHTHTHTHTYNTTVPSNRPQPILGISFTNIHPKSSHHLT